MRVAGGTPMYANWRHPLCFPRVPACAEMTKAGSGNNHIGRNSAISPTLGDSWSVFHKSGREISKIEGGRNDLDVWTADEATERGGEVGAKS